MVSVVQGAWFETAPIVDVVPNRRVFARKLYRAASLTVALARTWWPLWLPMVVLRSVAPWWLAAGLVADAALMAVILSARARSWFTRLPNRTGEAVFRWRWPRLCAQAGVVVPADGAIRFPRLVDVELHGRRPWAPDWMWLRCEPVAQQEANTWSVIGSRLARQLRFAVNTAIPVDDLTLDLRLRRERLPTKVVLGTDVPLERVAPDGSRIVFGDSALGGHVAWQLDQPTRTSLLITGTMGGGKSDVQNKTLLWVRERILAGDPIHCVVIAPKGGGEFDWCEDFTQVIVDDPMLACLAVAWIRAEVRRRAAYLKRRKVGTWLQLEPAERARLGGRLVIIIDEFVAFINEPVLVSPPGDGTGKKARDIDLMQLAQRDLQAISSQGRALGVNLVVATQHAIGETMGSKFGSTLIANLGGRIGVGALEPSGAATLFGKSHGESVAARSRARIPGRMFYAGLSTDEAGDGPVAGQGWYAPPELLHNLVNPTVDHIDFTRPPTTTPDDDEDQVPNDGDGLDHLADGGTLLDIDPAQDHAQESD